MSRGYSILTAREISEADKRMVGVQLGQLCVKLEIPIKDIAEHLGVSRQAVYAWFLGKAEVSDKHYSNVEKLIRRLKQ